MIVAGIVHGMWEDFFAGFGIGAAITYTVRIIGYLFDR